MKGVSKITENEKRKHARFLFRQKVYSQNKELGIVKNLSSSGCFIATENKGNNISELTFELPVLPQIHKIVEIKCKTMWRNKNGIGTNFSLNDENRKILSAWAFGKKFEEKSIRI